jgi:predicted DNA-binding protein (UPF0251 family)
MNSLLWRVKDNMGRPLKCRRVAFLPEATYFKPAGVPLAGLAEICLSFEEAEAIRLKDLEGLEQEECAQRMSVSRTTFARVLSSARQKMADVLLNSKALRIDGGNFEVAPGITPVGFERGRGWGGRGRGRRGILK